jgi:hypothetical protein
MTDGGTIGEGVVSPADVAGVLCYLCSHRKGEERATSGRGDKGHATGVYWVGSTRYDRSRPDAHQYLRRASRQDGKTRERRKYQNGSIRAAVAARVRDITASGR